jgi:hypothetical protein
LDGYGKNRCGVILVKIKLLLFVILIFGFSNPSTIADSKYPKTDSQTLEKIKTKATFKMLVPHKLIPNWTLEIKYPYPLDLTKPIGNIRLHYFNKEDAFMVGIEQFKATGYKITREEISIEPNGKQIRRSVTENFMPDYSGEVIFVNNHEGRFMPFKPKGKPGGYLWWIEDDTYISMDSQVLTKDEMMKIAKSMQ